jgi:hypothetical protein
MAYPPPSGWRNPALPSTEPRIDVARTGHRWVAQTADDAVLVGIWFVGWIAGVTEGWGLLYLAWFVNAVVVQGLTGFTAVLGQAHTDPRRPDVPGDRDPREVIATE